MGDETSASEQKGVMQWTGTLLRNVACFRLRSGLAMWFVHGTAAVTELWRLDCFLALLPRSFVLVRCLREANVAIYWAARQAQSLNGFSVVGATKWSSGGGKTRGSGT